MYAGPPIPIWMPPQPVPGIPVRPPLTGPQPGQVIVAYEVVEPRVGCCECSDLNITGIMALILLVFFFWPLAFLPCVMRDCHESGQRPIYGYPPAPAAVTAMPVAMPYAAPAQGMPMK